MSVVLIIGMGDMGERLAAGLAVRGRVRRLVLAGRSGRSLADVAALTATVADCRVEPVLVDATRQDDVAALLASTRPDLVVQCASLRSPWELAFRDDAAARAVAAAGLGLRLPYQLPVVLAVMRAAKDAGYAGPVANLSFPDGTGPVLRRLGLAPTLGLGNAGMIAARVRAALRAARPDDGRPGAGRSGAGRPGAGRPGAGLPLIRVLAHHSQLGPSMRGLEPVDPAERCRVYLGEDGKRDDAAAYRAPGMASGLRYNAVTAAVSLPVLEALLPGADPLRYSVPAPAGLPGGYPVRIAVGAVTLDLPPALTKREAIARNEDWARGDGIERVDDDGTVHFTREAREAVAAVDPRLAEPLTIADLLPRAAALDAALAV